MKPKKIKTKGTSRKRVSQKSGISTKGKPVDWILVFRIISDFWKIGIWIKETVERIKQGDLDIPL